MSFGTLLSKVCHLQSLNLGNGLQIPLVIHWMGSVDETHSIPFRIYDLTNEQSAVQHGYGPTLYGLMGKA